MHVLLRRLLPVLAMSLMFVGAITAAPAGAVGNSQPFPGNPHWLRSSGYEAVVQYHVDASAKGLHALVSDAVYNWNKNSPYMHLQMLPLGGDCRGVTSYCVTVAEANNYPCGAGKSFLSWDTTSYGHNHFRPALIAVNLLDCNRTLLDMKYAMCHEVGHTQGVDHDPETTIRPCSPGDGLPVANDYNVRNILGYTPG